MIKGVLFDMDGVLVDSEKYISQAAIMMFKEHGIEVNPEDFLPFVGAGENRYLGGVAEKYDFKMDLERDKARTYQLYGEIVKGKLEPLAGVKSFISKCKQKGLKIAVATSADKVKMEINLKEIGFGTNTFDGTINGLEVERQKPYPDIFLKASKKIGVNPEDCLVVEDAINGIKAAKAAKARCLALTTSFTPEQLSDADWVASNLEEAPDDVLNW